MPPPRKTNVLQQAVAAYIAGLIDGEGTVTLVRKHANENRQLSVSISSTEIGMLEYVREVVGVGHITTKRIYKPHHARSFAYSIHNRQALSLLRQVLPFLRSYKQKRARIIVGEYVRVTPRNGKYNPELLSRRQRFEEQVLAIKAH